EGADEDPAAGSVGPENDHAQEADRAAVPRRVREGARGRVALDVEAEDRQRRRVLISSPPPRAWTCRGGVEVLRPGAREIDLLLALSALIREEAPAILLTHNGYDFDLPFIYARRQDRLLATGRATTDEVRRCRLLSAHERHAVAGIRATTLRYMNSEFAVGLISPLGLLHIDGLVYYRRTYALSSYGLDALGAHFLGAGKEAGVAPADLFAAFARGPGGGFPGRSSCSAGSAGTACATRS
ncbi:MAG: 3'-5' exonuclease, partial [Pseudomonadota bacterium]